MIVAAQKTPQSEDFESKVKDREAVRSRLCEIKGENEQIVLYLVKRERLELDFECNQLGLAADRNILKLKALEAAAIVQDTAVSKRYGVPLLGTQQHQKTPFAMPFENRKGKMVLERRPTIAVVDEIDIQGEAEIGHHCLLEIQALSEKNLSIARVVAIEKEAGTSPFSNVNITDLTRRRQMREDLGTKYARDGLIARLDAYIGGMKRDLIQRLHVSFARQELFLT